MISRLAEASLVEWLGETTRKPLVLRGARQVGKSTLVRQFAAHQGLDLMEINLERHLYLDHIFKTLKIDLVLREIEGLAGKGQHHNTLIFLDEIQATPNALQALRYFYEDRPELPVIAAGSLLEFTLSDHAFSMPVGRIEYRYLYPATFREFLSVVAADLTEYLNRLTLKTPLPDSVHQRLLEKQREYLYVGGMPEAIAEYIKSSSLEKVARIHRSIAETYEDDFAKYVRRQELMLLQKVFRYVPRAVGRKVKYSAFSREDQAKEVKKAISLLSKARICTPVYNSNCSGLPLFADIDENTYKLLFMDIGIFNHICGNDWLAISALEGRELVHEGAMAEQFIGQHLPVFLEGREAPKPVYWLRESKSANAEVDYVISRGNWIVPIEVKAGKSGSLKSLQQFVLSKNPPVAVRFDLNPLSIQKVSHSTRTASAVGTVAFQLLSLPLYAVEELPRLIDELRAGR